MIPVFEIDFSGTGKNFQVVPPPRNWQAIRVQLSFTNEFPSSTMKSINFEWVNENYINIAQYFQAGTTGGQGVGEGLPLQIYVMGSSPKLYVFQGVIDLSSQNTTYQQGVITAPVKKIGSIDWFNDTAAGVTFTLLSQTSLGSYSTIIGAPGSNSKYFYKRVPYTVTIEDDIPQTIILLLEEFAMGQHLYASIKDTIAAISKLSADSATDAVQLGTSTPSVVGDIIVLIAQIAYDLTLILALVENLLMLYNQFGLNIKYKYAMEVRDIVNAGFDYINSLGTLPFNLTFNSSILTDQSSPYYHLTLMPKKILKENVSWAITLLSGPIQRGTEIGVPGTYGYPDVDLAQVLKQLGTVFNAKGYMVGNVYNFEEVHYYNNIAAFKVPNTNKPGYNLPWPAPYTLNWSECAWNYRVAFGTDSMDERTSIVYTGTSCQVTLQPKTVINTLNVLPPGIIDITFPYALAKRKEYLSLVQNVVNDIVNVFDAAINGFVSAINGLINAINSVVTAFGAPAIKNLSYVSMNTIKNSLIGCLEVSADQWELPKLFIGAASGNDWKIDPNNGANNNGVYNNPNLPSSTPYLGCGYVSSYALMQQYHGKNLLTRGEQWKIYKGQTFPLCPNDFNYITNNNILTNPQGKNGKFKTLEWTLYNEIAEDVEYRVNEIYTNNLYETIAVDGN